MRSVARTGPLIAFGGGGVTIDADGNTTLAGWTDGALPGTTNVGEADIVIMKFDADGNDLWARQVGTSGYDSASDIATDMKGSTTLVGSTDGALPGFMNAGHNDIVIIKIDPDGNQLWARQLGTAGNDSGTGITSDDDGNPTLAGSTSDGALPGYSNAGGYDIVLAKYLP